MSVYQEVVVQWSLGLLLHSLSACGHSPAQALTESIGTKWLREVLSSDGTEQVRQKRGCGTSGVIFGMMESNFQGHFHYLYGVLK